MDTEILQINTIDSYNSLFGLETRHPLVAVVDLADATRFPSHFTMNYGIYALFLKQTRCGDIRYGRQTYDYQEGTVTSRKLADCFSIPILYGARRWGSASRTIRFSTTLRLRRCISATRRRYCSATVLTR